MQIVKEKDTMRVSEIELLDTAHARAFELAVEAALPSNACLLEIDLSHTTCLDCGGLGALVSLRKRARTGNSNLTVRLRNPRHPAERLLRLTHADEVFTVVT